jgi:hypothetical protein
VNHQHFTGADKKHEIPNQIKGGNVPGNVRKVMDPNLELQNELGAFDFLLLVREEAWNFEREGNNYGVFKLLKVYSHLLFINKL